MTLAEPKMKGRVVALARRAMVDATFHAHLPSASPYVVALASSTLSAEAFAVSQVQFGFAVGNFSKPLALLAARSDSVEKRFVFVENLWDEHGEGNLAKSHAATFGLFLNRLCVSTGVDKRRLSDAQGPAVDAFNQAIVHWADEGDVAEAAASLGMIERLFADYSRLIAKAIVARGWLREDELAHYNLHQKKDHEHADGLFWVASDLDDRVFESAILRGAKTFSSLYASLAKLD